MKTQEIKLTPEVLEKEGFINRPPAFENIILPYYVKSAILMFYNISDLEIGDPSFLVGYGFWNDGKHYAATFRWINTLSDLKLVQKAILGK